MIHRMNTHDYKARAPGSKNVRHSGGINVERNNPSNLIRLFKPLRATSILLPDSHGGGTFVSFLPHLHDCMAAGR